VNLAQSSNDVIRRRSNWPLRALTDRLLPQLDNLASTIDRRATELRDVVKTGRTHLMDAVPVTFGQELSGWSSSIRSAAERIRTTLPRSVALPGVGLPSGRDSMLIRNSARVSP
jgi:fumarate hydratase class II